MAATAPPSPFRFLRLFDVKRSLWGSNTTADTGGASDRSTADGSGTDRRHPGRLHQSCGTGEVGDQPPQSAAPSDGRWWVWMSRRNLGLGRNLGRNLGRDRSGVGTVPAAVANGGETGTTADGGGSRPGPPRFVVYLKKRPLYGTHWAGALTALGQDHVGVVIARYEDVCDCGGRLPVSLQPSHAQVAFDFGPLCGKDFSIFKITGAEIRCDKFDHGDSALVASSHRTWEEVEAFNANYGRTYHLGVTDCRDYAAALVQFMTGVTIQPANVAQFIASANDAERSHDTHSHHHHDNDDLDADTSKPFALSLTTPVFLGLGL